jgi:murein DD-endopeptidase MepM/ murein hydrolase activator NlpD
VSSKTSASGEDLPGFPTFLGFLLSGLLWFVTILMVAMLVWVGWQRAGVAISAAADPLLEEGGLLALQPSGNTELPEFQAPPEINAIARLSDVHTVIPERQRATMMTYEVEAGDSVFTIAKQFDIKPETVLWANEDILDDNPNMLSIGQQLKIPAEDGVVYKWRSSDTIEGVARKFKADPNAILTWPDNHLDLANPKIASGTLVMVPGGERELKTWVVPTIWRANAGATRNIATGCDTSGGTAFGSGTFAWPTVNRSVSGNDYWSGHLGIDIAAATGAPVYASDSGVVVYAAGISGGYGLMVMIDHGNGFHTLYAHLSQTVARCGQNVGQGQTIAYSGSSGNSTGPHLHFEIRYGGAFVNPWDYLQ